MVAVEEPKPNHALQARTYVPKLGRVVRQTLGYRPSGLLDIFRLLDAPWLGQQNQFYSIATVKSSGYQGRFKVPSREDFVFQEWIPFDIDGVDLGIWDEQTLVDCVDALLPKDGQRIYIWSGHGLHVLVKVEPFTDARFFDYLSAGYKAYADAIESALSDLGMSCDKVDRVVWEAARMLRLPGTINQKMETDTGLPSINKKTGEPYSPVPAWLITFSGDGPSLELWQRLKDFKPSFDDEPVVGGDREKDSVFAKLIFLVQSKGLKVIEYPRYYRVQCPFHDEKEPSYVLYKDGGGWGLDRHAPVGDSGASVSPYFLWLRLTYPDQPQSTPSLDNPLYLEYRDFLGIPPGYEPAQKIIEKWALENLEPLYRTQDGFYSRSLKQEVTTTRAGRWYTRELARMIYERSIEIVGLTGKKLHINEAHRIYNQFAPAAFRAIQNNLMSMEEQDSIPTEAKEEILLLLRAAFNYPVSLSLDGQFRTDTLVSLMRTAPWNNVRWQEAGQYEAVYRHFDGKWQFAFLPMLLQRLPSTSAWFKQHKDASKLSSLLVKAGVAEREQIRFKGGRVYMLKLSDDAMQFVSGGQTFTPDEAATSNRIPDLFDDSVWGGKA